MGHNGLLLCWPASRKVDSTNLHVACPQQTEKHPAEHWGSRRRQKAPFSLPVTIFLRHLQPLRRSGEVVNIYGPSTASIRTGCASKMFNRRHAIDPPDFVLPAITFSSAFLSHLNRRITRAVTTPQAGPYLHMGLTAGASVDNTARDTQVTISSQPGLAACPGLLCEAISRQTAFRTNRPYMPF